MIARHHAFGYALERIETFPGVVWLAPEPDARFRALMSAVHAAFPGYPPYGGGHHEVIPHATLTSCAPEELDAAVARLEPRVSSLLPVDGCADAVTLLVEEELDRWRERLRFTLPE